MGERKGTNKYYPPDFDPGKGSLNAYHGTHALRERARKINEGIIIIRFEMPYNIWCNGCGNHIGMGVRYNAQKRKVGNYYTTPIYKFRMKCHLCDQHFEIQTDPKNCEYVILSGARRKEERWDPAVTENIQTTDRDVKAKLISDAMFKLEHEIEDKQKAKKAAPTLNKIRQIRDVWDDDFAVNQILRKKFRAEKNDMQKQKALDDKFKERNLLPSSIELVEESEEDSNLAKRMRFGEDVRPDIQRKRKKQEIKQSSIFEKELSVKGKLARRLANVGKKNKSNGHIKKSNFTETSPATVVIEKKYALNKDSVQTENWKCDFVTAGQSSNDESEKSHYVAVDNARITLLDRENESNDGNAGESSEYSIWQKSDSNGLENGKSDSKCLKDSNKSLLVGYDSSSDSCEMEDENS